MAGAESEAPSSSEASHSERHSQKSSTNKNSDNSSSNTPSPAAVPSQRIKALWAEVATGIDKNQTGKQLCNRFFLI